ncbi:MAG: GNAT family N-acetyltransferase [Firmicutes bacterium]|nr:GNAT family N-acetyltransferase [Bacillota bacterium]
MKIEIRTADLHDLEQLISWRMEVLQQVFHLQNKPCYELQKANQEYYQKALAEGSHFAVFAQNEGNIIGCGGVCFYQEMPSPDNPSGECAYLMNIYTRSEYRKHGVGEKIILSLIREARHRKITKIYLETSDCARSLYEKLGFTDMNDYLILK